MSKSIGFIGGGQMAEALIKGLIQSGTINRNLIGVVDPVRERKGYLESTYSIKTYGQLDDLVGKSDVIILAVKPQVMAQVLADLKECVKGQLIITIAAGLPLSFYADKLQSADIPIIRVMPNTPALILEGASSLCGNSRVSDSDLAFANTLFSAIGTTVLVEERLMDAVTGVSGSGPAYVFSFIEALVDGGIKMGLSRDVATELAIQTVVGAARLVKESGKHPAELRGQVTSPGGTTICAIHVLENSGFNGIVMQAVEAACNRSAELGKI